MIGIDIIKISRMQKMMERFGEKALKKFLSDSEIALVKSSHNAAGFWAAKEACSKALGVGIGSECSFYDIQLSKTPKGAPILTLTQRLYDAFNIQDTSLSITHDGEYAIAVVAIEVRSPTTNKV